LAIVLLCLVAVVWPVGPARGAGAAVGEIEGEEDDRRGVDLQSIQPPAFVGLGGGMVDLEPPNPGLGVTQRAAVVAGADGGHLLDSSPQPVDHGPIKERRAAAEVVRHALAGGELRLRRTGHVLGQPLVRRRVPERGRQPLETEPVGGHPLRRE
jgi:hypothetical protein